MIATGKNKPAAVTSSAPATDGLVAADGLHNQEHNTPVRLEKQASTFQVAINRRYAGKLPPGDPRWGDFNDSFETLTLDAGGLADEIRAGHAYTAPHEHTRQALPSGKQSAYRHSLNFQHAQHLALDFDTGDQTSTLDALQSDPFIARRAAFLHTTASHTPDKPRARAVFILDQPIMSAGDYADAMTALVWKYTGHADSSCKDAARLFFGAPGCEVRMIGGTLPLAVVKTLIGEFKTTLEAERARTPRRTFAPSTPELQDVADALRRIPAQGDYYDDWLRVLMAVASEYPGADGVSLCEAWSPGYPGEIERKFKTFSANGNGRGKVGIGTLFFVAKQHGWIRTVATGGQHTGGGSGDTTEQASASESDQAPSANTAGSVKQPKPPVPTDDELAGRWIAAHPGTSWGLGEFRRYEAGIWPIIALDRVRREIKGVLEVAKAEGVRPTARQLASVMELARVEVAQPPEVWDADPDILICANGALHIPTRTLQAHGPQHYATSRLSFDYDPAARAGIWEYVLNGCAPESKGFLQEFAGYALTTDTRYEIALWLAGQPGGGKSTILAGLEAMLGARACLLGLSDIEKSRFALTNLPGKTLAISTEQPGGYVAAAHVLNAIISGEPITVDRKFREAVTIIPRAKLAWALNELPRVGPEGVGLFRRVKVISFPPIPEQDRDPNVKEQVKLEGAGILNWALDGLARLRARGRFEIPKCVQDATAHFRETNDIPSLFVAECCFTGENSDTGRPYRAQGSVLYKAYSEWCKDNGHKPASSTSIAEDWRRLGFEKYQAAGKSWWRYVGLVDTLPQVSTP